MTKNVVNLTLHKNTLPKRQARQRADLIKQIGEFERQAGDLAGFAIVTWDADGSMACQLELPPGQPVTKPLVESYVLAAVRHALNE